MLLLIDNYDSFTFNLVQTIGVVAPDLEVRVVRNDKLTLDEARALDPEFIVISPGPCTPTEAGVSNDVLRAFAPTVPTLGVCLGHQCIGHVFGGVVERAARLMHGKTDRIFHDGQGVYAGLPNPFVATRYHSLILRPDTLDAQDFRVTAWTDQDEIMGVRHQRWPLEGVQFHPESFLTECGPQLIANFLGRPAPPVASVPSAAPSV